MDKLGILSNFLFVTLRRSVVFLWESESKRLRGLQDLPEWGGISIRKMQLLLFDGDLPAVGISIMKQGALFLFCYGIMEETVN